MWFPDDHFTFSLERARPTFAATTLTAARSKVVSWRPVCLPKWQAGGQMYANHGRKQTTLPSARSWRLRGWSVDIQEQPGGGLQRTDPAGQPGRGEPSLTGDQTVESPAKVA